MAFREIVNNALISLGFTSKKTLGTNIFLEISSRHGKAMHDGTHESINRVHDIQESFKVSFPQFAQNFPKLRYASACFVIDKKTNDIVFDTNDPVLLNILSAAGRHVGPNIATMYAYDALGHKTKDLRYARAVSSKQGAHHAFKRYRRKQGVFIDTNNTRATKLLDQNKVLAQEWKREGQGPSLQRWKGLNEAFPKGHHAWDKNFDEIVEWMQANNDDKHTQASFR